MLESFYISNTSTPLLVYVKLLINYCEVEINYYCTYFRLRLYFKAPVSNKYIPDSLFLINSQSEMVKF